MDEDPQAMNTKKNRKCRAAQTSLQAGKRRRELYTIDNMGNSMSTSILAILPTELVFTMLILQSSYCI
jgi:hypothetical protein